MDSATVILILFAVLFVLEYITGQIFIFKKTRFPSYSEHPKTYWEHLTWHFTAVAILAVLQVI